MLRTQKKLFNTKSKGFVLRGQVQITKTPLNKPDALLSLIGFVPRHPLTGSGMAQLCSHQHSS